MDDEQFNMNIRKYLKKVGINSQREIEKSVRVALDNGDLIGNENLNVKVTLAIESINLTLDVDGEISLD
ncbi:MAG: DUF6494 family protein [Rhodospirillales bacterium]|jgi:hypothetical protein